MTDKVWINTPPQASSIGKLIEEIANRNRIALKSHRNRNRNRIAIHMESDMKEYTFLIDAVIPMTATVEAASLEDAMRQVEDLGPPTVETICCDEHGGELDPAWEFQDETDIEIKKLTLTGVLVRDTRPATKKERDEIVKAWGEQINIGDIDEEALESMDEV